MAATFAAGERVRDVYEFTAVHDAIIVAGSAEDVGIMGWFTGGGHGPLSSTYGMGADNVLQVKVVTTSGELLTANACQNEDLFWALSGGGGGTFGVVIEVTMKAYPSPQTTQHVLSLVPTTANLTDFFNSVAYLLSELPRLKAGGMQGTMALVPPQFAGLPPQFDGGETMAFSWGLNVYDKPNGTIECLLAPIVQKLDPLNGSSIIYTSQTTQYPDFFTAWNDTIGDEAVGTDGVSMGSRLLPETAFVDQQRLVEFLQNATTPFAGVPFIIELCLVANSDRRGDDIAMNPAWRDAVAHFVIFTGFPDWDNFTTAKETFDVMTFQKVAALKSLAPESGAYFNEADPYDPNWQYDFFGANYARLREIKKKYDPQTSLWCLGCVGNGDWVEVEQQSGRICRAEWATEAEIR
jgi:FAD/FMN-containing dehydrogenase